MKLYKKASLRPLVAICLIFQLAATLPVTFAQSKADKIDKLMSEYTEYGQFNGSALVAEKGEIILKKGYGFANMEWDIPNASDTKHRLGSVTKQFTAMLIMQLVEQGKLELDAKVTDYLPEYPKQTGGKITIHHLLTHTSGIPNYTAFPGFFQEQSRDPYSPEEFVVKFAGLDLDFEPGEKYSYSNSGYFLLGVIIEKVTGKPYEQVLQENIFTPLKMVNSGYDHFQTILKKRATGYETNGRAYRNASYLDMSIPYSAGSLYSTVEDLYLWDQALYTEQLLTKKSRELMFAPHAQASIGYYGYGWMTAKTPVGLSNKTVDVIAHSGGINGFNTLIVRIPSEKHLIVLLNNTGGTALNEMSTAIAGILYKKPYAHPKMSVARAISKTINKEGVEKGLELYNEIKSDDSYALSESEMNALGYDLIGSGNLEAAIAVFKLNVEAFPESSNVYDSYGEALLMYGDKENAIVNYKKSVELNPGSQGGIEVLKKLGEVTRDLSSEIVVDAALLESYVGKYELNPGFVITVSKDGDQLKAQATGQPEFMIYPKSDNVFYLKVIDAQITFNKNGEGAVASLTLHQGGQDMFGKRLP